MAAATQCNYGSILGMSILISMLVISQCYAQQLIEKYDKIEFYAEDNPQQVLSTIELNSVSFYTNVSATRPIDNQYPPI